MNLCQDTLYITGKLLFHKTVEMQQLEKRQRVQNTAFPPKLGVKPNKTPLAPSSRARVFPQAAGAQLWTRQDTWTSPKLPARPHSSPCDHRNQPPVSWSPLCHRADAAHQKNGL